MEAPQKETKSIFEFDNYRELLRHLYAQHKLKNKNFSYRFFAKSAGFSSANFLRQVTDGKSKLSIKSIHKFIKGFKLGREEGQFFYHLVLLNQAKTTEEKEFHAHEILRCRSYREIHPLHESQYNYFSRWYYMSVRELVNFPDFKNDPAWVAQALVPPISYEEAKEALEDLTKLGVLELSPDGKLVQSSRNITTSDEIISATLAQCHREFLRLAAESIDRIPRNQRDLSFVSFSVSQKNLGKIKESLDKFRREILQVVGSEDSCDSVYHLNLQLFPTAQTQGRNADEI
jgi:uncharacterized protein (TIGR02147 family)